jgi:outer membrane protein TolC
VTSLTVALGARAQGQGATVISVPEETNSESVSQTAIDLRTAMALAEQRAPELQEPAAERRVVPFLRAAAARVIHKPPRAVMSVGPRRGGSQIGWDVTAAVYQEFSLGGYGRHLDSYASAVEGRANADYMSIQRDARVRAGLVWVDARVARETFVIRREALAGARETLRVAEARAQVGKSSPAEAALARGLVGSVDASVLAAQGEITVADAQLRYLCGFELHQPFELLGTLNTEARVIDEMSIRNRALVQAPELAKMRAQANAFEQAAQLGKAASRPHIELGPSVTHEGTGDWIFQGNVSLPLPGVDPYAADNAHRRIKAEMARARVTIAEQNALKEVEIALHEHALNVRDSLRAGTIEPSMQAVREFQLQFEVGRIDLTTLLAARRELLTAQERWALAAGDVLRAEVKLMRFTNDPLLAVGK